MKSKESLHFAFIICPECGKHSAQNEFVDSLASARGEKFLEHFTRSEGPLLPPPVSGATSEGGEGQGHTCHAVV